MFQLADTSKPVKWPVEFKYPTDKGEADVKFYALFYFKTEEEIKKLNDSMSDEKFLQSVVHSFEELKDSDGKAIKGSKSDVKKLCSITRIKHALINAFYDFNSGDLKNFVRQ
ncbi:MAG: hypothetical protein COA86_02760 [Kangiella sp.]|nr:MAG: hypothetical protein COA86_02760 [Kangiella sp.]